MTSSNEAFRIAAAKRAPSWPSTDRPTTLNLVIAAVAVVISLSSAVAAWLSAENASRTYKLQELAYGSTVRNNDRMYELQKSNNDRVYELQKSAIDVQNKANASTVQNNDRMYELQSSAVEVQKSAYELQKSIAKNQNDWQKSVISAQLIAATSPLPTDVARGTVQRYCDVLPKEISDTVSMAIFKTPCS